MKASNETLPRGGTITRRDLLCRMAALGGAAMLSRSVFATSPLDQVPLVGAAKPVRFALIGDWGSGNDGEKAIAELMAATHARTPLDLVATAGDNIYPNG